jgi:hypothetical protein
MCKLKRATYNSSVPNAENNKTNNRTHQLTPALTLTIEIVARKGISEIRSKLVIKTHTTRYLITDNLRNKGIKVISSTLIVQRVKLTFLIPKDRIQ